MVRTTRGSGEDQDGSFHAWNMLKEVSNEALEQLSINFRISAFLTSQHFKANAFKRERFCLLIKPRADISTEKWNTRKSCSKSETNGAYLSSLYVWLRSIFDSHGQVSSNKTQTRLSSSTKNRSGRSGVTMICWQINEYIFLSVWMLDYLPAWMPAWFFFPIIIL